MSNFTVNGVYSYTSANIYSYLGRTPINSNALERAFDDFNITPTGKTDDLKKLNSAMYEEYSKQVQQQIDRRTGIYSGRPYELSLGRATKVVSNMDWKEIESPVEINRRKTAEKL